MTLKEGTPNSNLELCSGVIPYNLSLDGVASKNIEEAKVQRENLVKQNANWHLHIKIMEKNGGPSWIQSYQENIKTNEATIRVLNARITKWTNVDKVLDGKNITDPTVVQELSLVNNYGSKMARLINWLNDSFEEDENNRFILFSKVKGTVLLDSVASTDLTIIVLGLFDKDPSSAAQGWNNCCALGRVRIVILFRFFSCVLMKRSIRNVIQKTEKLAQFKQDNVKVLLMSLGNSAAGTNLIEANYVVLVDPMQGSVEEARAYEMQALGRAHRQGQDQKVHLVRFVVRDSVEEELYTRNKSSGRSESNRFFVSLCSITNVSSKQQTTTMPIDRCSLVHRVLLPVNNFSLVPAVPSTWITTMQINLRKDGARSNGWLDNTSWIIAIIFVLTMATYFAV